MSLVPASDLTILAGMLDGVHQSVSELRVSSSDQAGERADEIGLELVRDLHRLDQLGQRARIRVLLTELLNLLPRLCTFAPRREQRAAHRAVTCSLAMLEVIESIGGT